MKCVVMNVVVYVDKPRIRIFGLAQNIPVSRSDLKDQMLHVFMLLITWLNTVCFVIDLFWLTIGCLWRMVLIIKNWFVMLSVMPLILFPYTPTRANRGTNLRPHVATLVQNNNTQLNVPDIHQKAKSISTKFAPNFRSAIYNQRLKELSNDNE